MYQQSLCDCMKSLVVLSCIMVASPLSAYATGGSEGNPNPAAVVGLVGGGSGAGGDAASGGVIANDVNLYTGGVNFALPLLSVQGRAGLDVSVALHYSSHVQATANSANWDAQASWVGLGWDLSFGSVVSNHNLTRSYADDEYRLVTEDGASHELIQSTLGGNDFYLQDYRYWKITRLVEVYRGVSHVRGWQIKKEDGTVYDYGDRENDPSFGFVPSSRNATRYRICWGDYSGIATAFGAGIDSVWEVQWDLQRVRTLRTEEPQAIVFEYFQDGAYLSNGTQSSTFPYTRASHLSRITLPNGRRVDFVLETADRPDFTPYYSDNLHQELYEKKRLHAIEQYDAADNLAKRVELSYSTSGGLYLKSLLTGVTMSGTLGSTLPAYMFSYRQTDPNRLALERTVYPSGGHIFYTYEDYTSNAGNFASLDERIPGPSINPLAIHSWGSENVGVLGYKVNGDVFTRLHVRRWNGYWQPSALSVLGTTPLRVDADASDRIVCYWDNSSDLVRARYFTDGFWASTAFDVPDADFVWTFAGPDYVAALVSASSSQGIYIWKRDASQPTGWSAPSIHTFTGEMYSAESYSAGNQDDGAKPIIHSAYPGFFSLMFQTESPLDRPAFAASWDGMNWQWSETLGGDEGRRWCGGQGYYAVSNGGTVTIKHRQAWGTTWITTTFSYLGPMIRLMAAPDYFLCYDSHGDGTRLRAFKFAGYGGTNGWASHDLGLLTTYDSPGADRVGLQADWFVRSTKTGDGPYTHDVEVLEWRATGWVSTASLYHLVDNSSLGICVSAGSNTVALSREGSWVRACAHTSSTWINQDWSSYQTSPATLCGKNYALAQGVADNGFAFAFTGSTWTMVENIPWEENRDAAYHSAFACFTPQDEDFNLELNKWHSGSFYGKARYYALASRKAFDGASFNGPDTLWDKSNYEFWGGVLDESNSYPRFHKATVRGPFRGATPGPKEYTTSWFYNDVDDNVDTGFPDLDLGMRYFLDGTPYYTSSGNAVLGIDSNWTKTCFSIVEPRKGAFARRIDTLISCTDGVTDTTLYYYKTPGSADDNGSPYWVERYGSHSDTGRVVAIEKTVYAHEISGPDQTALRDSNLIGLSSEIKKGQRIGANEFIETQSSIEYAIPKADNDWHFAAPIKQWTYRTIGAAPFPSLCDVRTINGYAIEDSKDAHGTKTAAIYSSDGTFQTATVVNGPRYESVYADFEPGEEEVEHDPCYSPGFTFSNWTTNPVDAFTGKRAGRVSSSGSIVCGAIATFTGPTYPCLRYPYESSSHVFEGWVKCNVVGAFRLAAGAAQVTNSTANTWEHLRVEVVAGGGLAVEFRGELISAGTADFDDFRVYSGDALMSTWVYDRTTGNLLAEAGPDNIPTKYEYDDLGRRAAARNHKGELVDTLVYSMSRTTYPSGPFHPEANYVQSTRFRGYGSQHETVTREFQDGFGRAIQTRTQETATDYIVQILSYDANGAVDTVWKPYSDFGVGYSNDARTECDEYYNADGPGPDCNGKSYSETAYSDDALHRIDSTSAPGSAFSMLSQHVRRVSYGYNAPSEVPGYTSGGYFPEKQLLKKAVIDENGRMAAEFTDKLGFLVARIADSAGAKIATVYKYDPLGRLEATIFPKNRLSNPYKPTIDRQWYDALGQRLAAKTTDAGYDSLKYDKLGRLRFDKDAVLHAQNKFVYYKYDNHGRRTEWGFVTGANLFTQVYADDTSFPGIGVSFTRGYYNSYDDVSTGGVAARGKLTETSDAAHGMYRQNKYDDFGRLSEEKVKIPSLDLKTIQYSYNRAGQLLTESYPDLGTVTWTYDQAGRQSSLSESSSANPTLLSGITYWPHGAVKQMVYQRSDAITDIQWVDYTFTTRDWPHKINNGTVGAAATDDRFAASFDYTMVSTYNPPLDPEQFYNGNIRQMVFKTRDPGWSADSIKTYEFGYDSLNRLAATNIKWQSESSARIQDRVTYDRHSNALQAGPVGNLLSYCYPDTSNRLSRVGYSCNGAATCLYDFNGNMTVRDGRTQTMDWRNLMESIWIPHGQAGDGLYFTYDPLRQRVKSRYHWWQCHCDNIPELTGGGGDSLSIEEQSIEEQLISEGPQETNAAGGGGDLDCQLWGDDCYKIWTDVTTYYLFDQFGRVIAEYNGTGTLQRSYFHGLTGKVAMRDASGNRHCFLNDHLGSTRVLMGATGSQCQKITARYDYYPYGKTYTASVSTDPGYLFTGHRLHNEGAVGLYYAGARFYDPALMRFLTADPAGQYPSPYIYGGGIPLSALTRTGSSLLSMIG